jgi:hypothetical protein
MIEDFFHLHLELRISSQIFEKICNLPNGILRGLGGFMKYTRSRKSHDTVPLNKVQFSVKNLKHESTYSKFSFIVKCIKKIHFVLQLLIFNCNSFNNFLSSKTVDIFLSK